MTAPHKLVTKYDVPTPRYTSYPTVPFWEINQYEQTAWQTQVATALLDNAQKPISLYLHLPFCESLCTYCACNKRITKNHQVELPYLQALLQEWALYRQLAPQQLTVSELHLGGGTPTFFSPKNLSTLLEQLLTTVQVAKEREFSVEVHPNTTSEAHLQALYEAGFRRLSVGVQDFDPQVQYVINRPQTFEQTAHVITTARKMGYTSVNIDIIYGLPLQTPDSVQATIRQVQQLQPDRIAFYSYAHVPWKSAAQRRYTEADLPQAAAKRLLYELGKEALLAMGYREIGFDHFALANDGLSLAAQNNALHRNFMGYTVQQTDLLIGLGCSSISDLGTSFGQNIKEVEEYQAIVKAGKFPIQRGHQLSAQDYILQQHILNLMCKGITSWQEDSLYTTFLDKALQQLQPLAADGLVELLPTQITVTALGKQFLRNICACLDAKLAQQQSTQHPMFSQSA